MIDKEVARLFDRRSALFLTGGTVLTSVLVLRMLQMQLFNYREYSRKSQNNSYRVQLDIAQRGQILSDDGTPISRDVPIYRIYIIPEETKNIDELLDIISKDLKLKENAVKNIKKKINKQPKFQPVLVSERFLQPLKVSLSITFKPSGR